MGVEQSDHAIRITHSLAGQHTIEWHDPIFLPQIKTVMPPGRCNLYQCPMVWLDGMMDDRLLELKRGKLEAFSRLVLSCVHASLRGECPFLEAVDVFGAKPVHGMLVSNRQGGLQLALRIFRAAPAALLHKHCAAPVRETPNGQWSGARRRRQ